MSIINGQQGLLLAAATAASLLAVSVLTSSALSQTPSPTSTSTPTPTPTPATPSPTLSPPPTPSPFSNISSSELAAQRAKWNAAGIASYRYAVRKSCFCFLITVQPYIVTVIDGITESVVDEQGHQVNLDSDDYRFLVKLATMEQLFTEVERLSTGSYYLAEVTYDAAYGFPTKIASELSPDITDDQTTIQVSAFKVIQPGALPRTGGPR